jgi:flagellin
MALGVLNNLSAIYAENNLNNTNASLQTVLQQLSSGSRINSGADDAAGLSLVNGLAANSAALTQSETNSAEGVGLLQVADGALSQVTSLLNRAITLATEASNGTLNSTQDGAANQEYQSILAEVNNIGSTTTYNQQQVFNDTTTAIYTGDSSRAGSSVDDLFIRTLSSSSVGETGGAMSYSSGQNNVFIDLSKGGTNGSASDSLNASGTTTISVSYLTKGSSGTVTPATANITVGTGTNFHNTAQGLISAINDSGLGITASFGTASQAGTGAVTSALDGSYANSAALTNGSDTGIIISGQGIGVNTESATGSGVYTNGVGGIGTLTVEQQDDTLGGTLNITDSNGQVHSVTLGTANSTDTLAHLAATINAAGWGVTASVNSASVTNASGTHVAGALMTLSSASGEASVTGASVTDVNTQSAISAASLALAAGIGAGSTLGVFTVANSSDTLSGELTVTSGAGSVSNLVLGTAGSTDTLANLMATINGANTGTGQFANMTAAVNPAGTQLTITQTGVTGAAAPALALAAGPTGTTINDNKDASGAADGTASVVQTSAGAVGGTFSGGTTVNITVTPGTQVVGGPATFASLTASTAATALSGSIMVTPEAAGATSTAFSLNGFNITTLAAYINANNTAGTFQGITATVGGATLSFKQTDFATAANYASMANSTTSPVMTQLNGGLTVAGGTATGIAGAAATIGTITAQSASDALSGDLQITTETNNTRTFNLSGYTLSSLAQYINANTSNNAATSVTDPFYQMSASLNGNTLTLTQAAHSGTYGTLKDGDGTAGGANFAADEATFGTVNVTNANDTFTGGSITIAGGANVNQTYTFNLGTTDQNYGKLDNVTDLAAAINNWSAADSEGIQATVNSAGTQISLSTSQVNVNAVGVAGSSATTGLSLTGTPTAAGTVNSTVIGTLSLPVKGINGDTTASGSAGDLLSGTLTIGSSTITLGTTTGNNKTDTFADLAATINKGNYGVTAILNSTNTQITFATANADIPAITTITNGSTDSTISKTLNYATYNQGVTSSSYYNVGISGTVTDSSTGGGTSVNGLAYSSNGASTGVATMSYSDAAGQSLSATDLSSQVDSQAALGELNEAITDIAAQDGYIGAQINTLNSISQVMSTQEENVTSAQNAIQATDYASATSNMSKYEILSQTGIAALAQANQVQQEVTKLLQ